MIKLHKRAALVMQKLIEGLQEPGDHKKISNNDIFMPVVVECIGKNKLGIVYSVAHYFELNSDLIADPEMEFLHGLDEQFYCLSIAQEAMGIYREAVVYDGATGFITAFYPKEQADQTSFANTWMMNIQEQQKL